MSLIEVQQMRIDALAWDQFAIACGASFLGSYGAAVLIMGVDLRYFHVRHFEIRSGDRKVGQAAIGIRGARRQFLDGVQLLPAFQNLLSEALSALLAELGEGSYQYGSSWSVEPPREGAIAAIDGVRIRTVEPVVLQGIDFRRWPSFDDYLRQVSQNARRNAKRARMTVPPLRLRVRRRAATSLDSIALARLHYGVVRRKHLGRSFTRVLSGVLIRSLAMRRHAISATVAGESGVLSAYFAVRFGPDTFYIRGGSRERNDGAGWYLLLEMIRDAYERSDGDGRFFMGVRHDDTASGWRNLARSRQQCRVSEFPTSLVTFDYARQATPSA